MTCTCRSCAAGILTAGHCVDIDDQPWHDCPATRAVYGAPDPNPTTTGGTA